MIPTRTTRSSSRRSSILKPPKPRQPLQNLNFNSSSNESSPVTTTKLKRRVSFAEKKHVKEFCNSLEQGTVWDSTYEEHDLSNIKVPLSSDKEECDLENICKETVDNYMIKETNICSTSDEIIKKSLTVEDYKAPYDKELESTEFAYNPSIEKELPLNTSSIVVHDERKETDESVLPTAVPLSSESRVSRSFTIYEDGNLSNNSINCQESNVNVEMNTTSILNTRIEFTEMISNNIYPNINCLEKNEIENSLQNTLMELTQPVSPSIQYLEIAESSQQDIENINLNTTQRFNDVSMEMTTVVPTRPYNLPEEYFENDKRTNVSYEALSLIKTIPHSEDITCMHARTMEMTKAINMYPAIENNFDKTVIHDDKEMEFTTAVSTINKMHSTNLNLESDKTRIFHNNSMTVTATVSPINKMNTCEEKMTVTESTITEMTEAVSDTMEQDRVCDTLSLMKTIPHSEDITCMDARTMEMTKAINMYPAIENNFDKTVIHDDKEMEFTTAVSTINKMHSTNLNLESDKTRIFHNNSMTVTATVSPINKMNTCEEKMTVTESTITEMTEAVSDTMEQDRVCDTLSLIKTIPHSEDITCMDARTMEMTKAINMYPAIENNFDKTVIHDDKEMEFTTAVSTINKMHSTNLNLESDKTRIFHNNSMTVTATVSPINKMNTCEEKMTVTESTITEMTEAVSDTMEQDRVCDTLSLMKTIPHSEDITCMDARTMEMTKAINMYPAIENNFDKTVIDDDKEMEFTTAVSTINKMHSANLNLESDKTRIFHNNSVTNTATVSPINKMNTCEEKMTVTESTIMEMTETVSDTMEQDRVCDTLSLIKTIPHSEDITCMDARTMEMTKAINMYPAIENNFDKTVIHDDKEMEFTTAVSTINKMHSTNLNLESDKTRIFHNNSMTVTATVSPINKMNTCEEKMTVTESTITEMTEAVSDTMEQDRVCDTLSLMKTIPHSEDITCMDARTMEMTKAINMYPAIENNFDKTVIDDDKEMEFTTAVSTINKMHSANLNLESDKTRIFHNNSVTNTATVSPINKMNTCEEKMTVTESTIMEMTETVSDTMEQDRVCDTLSLIKTIPHSEDITCMDARTMEMTKAINMYPAIENNFDKTVIHDDKEMEFTTAVSTINKMHSTNLNLESDKTRIFHNNSMTVTATVSPINKMDTCEEKMTVTEPTIMEMTEAIPSLQRISQREDSVMNISEIKQTILPENFENQSFSVNSLNQTSVPDNILKDITASVVLPSLNLNKSPDKKNCIINNSVKDNCTKKYTKEVSDLANITANTILHVEQDTYASALNENNAEAACGMSNSVSSKPLHTVTSHISQNECFQHKDSQDIVSHSRRTYIIKPLCSDHSFTNSTKESSKNTEKSNNTEMEDNCCDQFLLENKDSFFNQSIEELESIKPPSFTCLDDLTDGDMSANTNYNEEGDTEKEVGLCLKSIETSGVTEYEEAPKLIEEVVLEENIDESRKCLNEYTSLDDQSINLKLELNIQTQTSEVQQLQLSTVDDANMEVQDLNSFSSTINDSEKNSICNVVSVPQDMNIQSNCNIENQPMELSSLNRSDTCNETLETHTQNNHLLDDKVKLYNDENVLNSMKVALKESSELQLSLAEKDITIELDPFSLLIRELRVCAQSDEIIWEVYHENIERKMFVIGFISCSLLVIVFLSDDSDVTDSQFIKDIKIISRLADDADDFISMVHRIILEKLDVKKVVSLYKNSETILSMLEYISKEVKLAMNFMFELKRLENLNLMEITQDRISFVSCTKRMDIILRITVIIKPFEKIEPQDILIHCVVGSVREEEIKKLITNINKDHKFLRRYMNDVRDYIYLMEESASAINVLI